MARKLNIYLNSEKVDQIANNQVKSFEVEKGEYKILADMKGGKSNTLNVKIDNDQDINIILGVSSFDTNFVFATPILIIFTFILMSILQLYSFVTPIILIYAAVYFIIRQNLGIKAFTLKLIDKDK